MFNEPNRKQDFTHALISSNFCSAIKSETTAIHCSGLRCFSGGNREEHVKRSYTANECKDDVVVL